MKKFSITKIKYFACAYFALLGLATLALSASTSTLYLKRDLLIMLALALPMLINKRIFHLMYGLLSAMITLTMLLVYTFSNNPWQIDISISMFVSGLFIFALAFVASLALVYVGTYSKTKNTFTLI
ncbi:MAG: hypothetical protein EOO50_13555 [Flavobacterium sp.]|uniref:hypothetical protein n=1 Tax=Flavobacterium sp. TaxID=239 RepID=UPI00122B565F|nr:hypothetical protein [Flavobacterium sp.]RZJ65484.1 MAG: hypothetical protein EOO50_13555 [Flavobacterium sp.]